MVEWLRRIVLGVPFTSPDLDEKTPLLWPTRPKDWLLLTYFILFVQGLGHLLPWNMFITAHQYFVGRFTCPPVTETTPNTTTGGCYDFDTTFESWFAIASVVSVLVMTAVNVPLQSRIPFQLRMLVSIVTLLLLFIPTISLVNVDSASWVDGFFAFTMITLVLMSLASGLFQGSTLGFSGILPQKYTAAVMGGQAFAGIFAVTARIISSVIPSSDPTVGTLVYFSLALAVVIICLVSFFVLVHLKFVQYHIMETKFSSEGNTNSAGDDTKAPEAHLYPPVSGRCGNSRRNAGFSYLEVFLKVLSAADIHWDLLHCTLIIFFFNMNGFQIKVYAASIFVVFMVTLSLFPSILSNINSTAVNPSASFWTREDMFDAFVCFLMFNVSDFFGRYITTWSKMLGLWRYVLITLALLRLLFIPFFFLCNVQPRSGRFPVLLASDAWPVAGVTAFGLSNGFLATMALISAPECVPKEQRETASAITVMFMYLGLVTGSGLSYLLLLIV